MDLNIKKYGTGLEFKNKNMQNYNFTCFFSWVWDSLSHTKGRTWIDGILRRGY